MTLPNFAAAIRAGCCALTLAGCAAHGTAEGPGVDIATAAMDGGMPQTALNVSRSVLREHPRDVGALISQAAALAGMNHPEAAMEAYRRALVEDPAAPAALLGLGRLELAHGSAADAERRFTKLLAARPADATALNNLGVSLDLQGRHAAAQEVYGRILVDAPDDRAASVNLALSLSLSGQAGRSVTMLRDAGSRPDATPRLRQDLAVALTLSGNPREAEKLLLTDLSPGDAAKALAGYEALDATKK
jgi:Flp pilus assembly protein TadD